MRALVHSLLLEALALEEENESLPPAERWYGSGAVPDTPTRPFAEERWGGRFPGVSTVRRRRLEVWIHDEEGDYDRIENALKFVYKTLHGVEHRTDGDGNEIITMSWVNDSTDLYDDGYRTNCMSSTFEVIGKEV